MTEEDFIHEIKDWFSLSKEPVIFDIITKGFSSAVMLSNPEEVLFFVRIIGPGGLNDMLVPCKELGPPTKDEWKVAGWMCTALNHAKQRTEDVLEELNLDGDSEDDNT